MNDFFTAIEQHSCAAFLVGMFIFGCVGVIASAFENNRKSD